MQYQSMTKKEKEEKARSEWPEETRANLILYLKKCFLFEHLSQ
jgi:hypothetical protein